MRTLIVLFALCTAACATPGDIYASEVDASATTPKALAEVSQCIQLRWAEAPITGPGGKTVFLSKNGFGQTLGMLSLSPTPTGTLAEWRQTGQQLLGGNDWRKCI